MSDELIHDVENSLRQERIERLWTEYGPYILGGVVLAVMFTGALAAWRSHVSSVNARETTILVRALDNENNAATLQDALGKLTGTHKGLGELTAAGMMVRDNKPADALKHYAAAAGDKSLPPVYSDLAVLQSVRQEWSGGGDKAKADTLIARLKPIADSKDNPWAGHAQMQIAEMTGQGKGDVKTARSMLAAINARGDDVPPSLHERATALDHILAASGNANQGNAR